MSKTTSFQEKTLATFKNKEVYKGSYVGMFPLEFEEKKGEIPASIHIIPIGEWMHDAYGPIKITNNDLREFVQNFNAGIRKGVFITAGHEGYQELPAVAWITALEMRENGLWGSVEWNESGKELLTDKAFKFFSPEFYRDYEDPQTHQIYRNVLTGGALTKSPYFKELEAIVFSDKNIKSNFNTNNMNLADVLAKDITTLTDEEKDFIKANAGELTEEQKTSHASVIEAPADEAETEDEKTAREEKEKGDANEAAGLNRDGSAKEAAPATTEEAPAATTEAPVAASEKGGKVIQMSEAEVTALRKAADEGALAFKELRKNKLDTVVSGMVFNEKSGSGKFLPKTADNLRAFAETLNDAQLAKFTEIVTSMPDLSTAFNFKEVGVETAFSDASAAKQVEDLTTAKMKANDKLTYSAALKEVFVENEGLQARYMSEVNETGKKEKKAE